MFGSISRAIAAISSAVPSIFRDAVGLFGVGLVSYGTWLIYEPAGFIVAGVICIVGALLSGAKPAP
jgi:hypothetical protein